MLGRLSFKSKILAFVLPLVAGLVLTSGILLRDNLEVWNQAIELKISADYFVAVSKVIHQLQTERGISSLFLNDKASQSDLDNQRTKTNEAIANLEAILSSIEVELQTSSRAIFQDHSELRKFVDEKGAAAEAIKRFGGLVARAIKLQTTRASLHPLDGLENRIISQSIFEAAKESLGRLRASTTSILAKNQPIAINELTLIEEHWAGCLANLQSPGLMISSETQANIEKAKASDDWTAIHRTLDMVRSKFSTGGYDQDPKQFFSTITRVINVVGGLIEFEAQSIGSRATSLLADSQRQFWSLLIALLIGISVICAIALRIIVSVQKDLHVISEGLRVGADLTSSSAEDLSRSSSSLSSGVTEQAAAVEETASSLTEVQSMVARTAESSQRAQSLATRGASETADGRASAMGVIDAIKDIQASTDAIERQVSVSNKELSEITSVITEIAEKTKVINDIVFQTKLLSFNASVEAARAGEYGKGFAVVAEEIGNLARMSGSSASEIGTLLNTSIRKVEEIVSKTKTSVGELMVANKEKVASGIESAEHCRRALDSLSGSVEEIARMVTEIARASQEQSQGVTEISGAMQQMDAVTQENSAASSRVASVAANMNDQARELESYVVALVRLMRGSSNEELSPRNEDQSQHAWSRNQEESSQRAA